jgi:hypothetical protein
VHNLLPESRPEDAAAVAWLSLNREPCMRYRRLGFLVTCLLAGAMKQTHAQQPLVVAPAGFESWRPAPEAASVNNGIVLRLESARKNRTRQAVLGGAIGTAAGLIGCTVISTLANDSADGGLSLCPLDSYLLIGGAGLVVGAAIGWVL